MSSELLWGQHSQNVAYLNDLSLHQDFVRVQVSDISIILKWNNEHHNSSHKTSISNPHFIKFADISHFDTHIVDNSDYNFPLKDQFSKLMTLFYKSQVNAAGKLM